jgi:hypothetical protein
MKAPRRMLRKIGQILFKKQARRRHQSPFRRYLSPTEAELLAERVSSAFETSITARQVQDVAKVVRYMEEQMIGRVAGDVDDHVLNYYMICCSTHLLAATTPAHGEIGVLFGGSLLMMLHALRSSRSDHRALVIDPLDGYYGQNLDPVTGLPVTLDNVAANIRHLGFEMNRVRIVKARSESQEALQVARAFPLASLWIDGDHSYEGIRRDWQNYSPLVIPGGYILIDNYHDGCFPGVDKFVDEDLLPKLAGWEVVANFSRSILFKKTA